MIFKLEIPHNGTSSLLTGDVMYNLIHTTHYIGFRKISRQNKVTVLYVMGVERKTSIISVGVIPDVRILA